MLPKWCRGFEDIPWDLSVALDHAMRVVSWMEHLSADDIPPPWMWPLEWELEGWFAEVDRRRKNPDSVTAREEGFYENNPYSDSDEDIVISVDGGPPPAGSWNDLNG